ncbi:hypothetical protein I79_002191 [Cricetulus griseus]|uniref:Uncharacterized protein n=1 Tax=Cricetulus griseus TaxID=10029 RepID=G3GWR1_CRIGR|nr:hypothetical protein I79_002191 [Cricetulus griseus]
MTFDFKSNHLSKHGKPSLQDYAIALHETLAFLILAWNRINNLKYCKILKYKISRHNQT